MISLRCFPIRMFYLYVVPLTPPKDSPLQNIPKNIRARSVVGLSVIINKLNVWIHLFGLPLLSWVFKSCFSCVVINKVGFAITIHVPHLPPIWEGSLVHNAAAPNNAIGSNTLPTLPCTYMCTYIHTYAHVSSTVVSFTQVTVHSTDISQSGASLYD